MHDRDPIAYFITWTIYGTYLQGDGRGWRKRGKGNQLPQLKLAKWHAERLKHPIILLSSVQRLAVELELERHCEHRSWTLWARAARSNHVHVVVTADGYTGKVVRDQLKANATRGLRIRWPEFRDRPVWTAMGDWRCINTEDELSNVMAYVIEAQDRMHLPKP